MANVERVVDGDTIDVSIDLGFNIGHKLRVRLAGIDAAEHRTVRGDATTALLKSVIEGKIVKITTYSPDKYGRYLAEIWLGDSLSINRQMIDAGIVKAYNGDSKSNLWTAAELADGDIAKNLL